MIKVAPSMLSADFLNLEKDVEMVNSHADLFHLDIMDGVFVPNISYGFPVVDAIARRAQVPMDAHLMIVNPEKYVGRFASSGVSMLSFHLNATENPAEVVRMIHDSGMKAGLAVNPDIEIDSLYPFIGKCDYFLIMSVFAGFGGQKFIEKTYDRVYSLKNELVKQGCSASIEVDGGVSSANAARLAECGADIFVAGSAVFKASDPASEIEAIRGGKRGIAG